MALQDNDLLVVQSQTDSKLYKLTIEDLVANVQAGAGVNFKGSVDLNNAPAAQTPDPVVLPANNGDFYMVESNAVSINVGWVMQGGETTADQGDRIIFDGDDNNWILITTGSPNAGTVTGITATLPLEATASPTEPVVTILEARTTTAAGTASDGKGTAGSVARLAEAADVAHDNGSPDPTAVVTADLLKATNKILNDLTLAPGGVQSVAEGTDASAGLTGVLEIPSSSGAVTIQVKENVFCPFDFQALDDINA